MTATEARPFPLVIAAPSGAGKTTLARALVERNRNAVFSLSATTRAPRNGERDGVDYAFTDDAGFDAMLAASDLLEWAWVHGRRYGTLRSGVEAALARGNVVVLDIDVQGARRVRDALASAVLVFVLPPSAGEMHRRLQGRGTEAPEEVATRLRTARGELDAVNEFDHVVVNDTFDNALDEIEGIMKEPGRIVRPADLDERIAALRRGIDELLQGGN